MLISVVLFIAIGFFYKRGKIAFLGEQAARASARAEAVKRQAMQAQIEPHMMFNTLANLKSLIRFDPAEAGRMLDLFIVYLRATLSSSRAETTTLEHEFALLKAYLGLTQVRMADRLSFALELPAALRETVVPPMLLQPLVENAIVHGLESKLEGRRIDVSASCEGGFLTLIVADDGLGLDRPDAEPGARLALGNIRARLASLYGEAASLTLTPHQPHGALARIVLPLAAAAT
ncbi:sensor histidine kinase [Roseateles oligotrophus]|nr:histidine kinase [Roseateles oligotrophus]